MHAPIPHSGPSGLLKGYDARKRKVASKSGGTITAEILSKPGKHVPKEKPHVIGRAEYSPVPKSMPDVPRHQDWEKRYTLTPQSGNEELSQHDVPKTKAGKRAKASKVMREFYKNNLHSGSHTGPKVASVAQAKAIAMKMSGQSRGNR